MQKESTKCCVQGGRVKGVACKAYGTCNARQVKYNMRIEDTQRTASLERKEGKEGGMLTLAP